MKEQHYAIVRFSSPSVSLDNSLNDLNQTMTAWLLSSGLSPDTLRYSRLWVDKTLH